MSYLISLLVLILDIYIIVKVLGNGALGTGAKVLWIVFVLFFPVIGALAYLLFGQKAAA